MSASGIEMVTPTRGDAWILTYTGIPFYPLDPRAVDVDIRDIAHALSNLCRFTGHTRRFYSVAEHSLLVSMFVKQKDALWGLLHDASEAYLCDIPSPLKRTPEFAFYKEAEKRVMACVIEKFGLDPEEPNSVVNADLRMLHTEAIEFMPEHTHWRGREFAYPGGIAFGPGFEPKHTEAAFLRRYEELTGRTS